MNVCFKWFSACLSVLLIGILGGFLCLTEVGLHLEEEWGLSWLFKLRGSLPAPQAIVVVSIDKISADILHLPDDPEKWPRSYHAQLIKKLNQQDPAIIAFNIHFGENRDPVNEVRLANAMSEQKNTILSNYLKQYAYPSTDSLDRYRFERVIEPIPVLADAALAIAAFPLPKSASTVKQFWTFRRHAGDMPTFPVAVFECYVLKEAYPEFLELLNQLNPQWGPNLPSDYEQLVREFNLLEFVQNIHLALKKDPESLVQFERLLETASFSPEKTSLLQSWLALLKSNDSLYLNHYGKAGSGVITTIPFYQALMSTILTPTLFNNKIVLVGYSESIEPEKSQGLYTVFSDTNAETISPIEIAATAIGNLLDRSWIRPLPLYNQVILILGWGLLLAIICKFLPYKKAMSTVIFFALFYLGIAYYLFTVKYLWLPVVIPILLQTSMILMVASIKHFMSRRQEHLNMYNAFSLYLPGEVVSKMALEPGKEAVKGYGQIVQGVCMATDAGQYTTLSETMNPSALSTLMNSYYAVIFPEVKNRGGIISDVIGDAMLALWAKANIEIQPRLDACRSALEIQAVIDRFNEAQPHKLRTRIGLHYGEMHLGNIGAIDHFEYRAVGDTVNTATRIEGLNKVLGTQILVSAPVVEHLTDFFTREIGHFVLQGKTVPVRVYELIARQGQVTSHWVALAGLFAEALSFFRSYQWPEALEAFLKIADEYPMDGPTLFYIQYIKKQASLFSENRNVEKLAVIEIGNITTSLHL